METKYTKGPWTIAAYGEPVKWLSIKSGAETIARVEAVETPLDAEGQANAALIKAAPRMLQALQKLMPEIEQLSKKASMTTQFRAGFYSHILEAKTAIAEAIGDQL